MHFSLFYRKKTLHLWKTIFPRLLSLILVLLLAGGGGAPAEEAQSSMPVMQLHQPEIGCANCYLLIAGDTVILVEGGTNAYKRTNDPVRSKETGNTPDKMLNYIAASGIDHIDAHFVTHYHNDHAREIPVFSRLYYREDTVLYGTSVELPEKFSPLPRGVYRHLTDGEQLDVGPFHVSCVGPDYTRREGEINEDSLNIVITYGSFRMLFTGDFMKDAVWKTHEDEVRDVDVFQFPHHGLEPFSVTSGALQVVNPKIVLVPGALMGKVRMYFLRLNMKPEVYGNGSGNAVILSDGQDYKTYDQVEPGAFAEDVHRATDL